MTALGANPDTAARGDQPLDRQPFEALRYLVSEKSELYRTIIDVFTAAKAEFRLHLRPAEIVARLLEREQAATLEETTAALDQLVAWGNLQAYHDSELMATLDDFRRRQFLYQLTAAGEAAELATAEFLRSLGRAVTLEAQALARIRALLAELLQVAGEPDLDIDKVAAILKTIAADAEQLTAQAQSFFRWLHEQTAQRGADLASFLRYKERLIDYLQRFLSELALQAGPIAACLEQLEPRAERFLPIVAEQEASAAFAKDEAEHQSLRDAALRRWRQRWQGLRRWFAGIEGEPQVKQLRGAAGAAIPRLLAIASQLHDQRTTRSDRRADLIELARWFLEADDDRQAHRLWSASFAAGSVRHMKVDAKTLEERDLRPVPAQRSWLDAPPISIAPQLRQTGRAPAASPARKVIDRSAELQRLRQIQENERRRLSLARRALIELGPRRLSEIGWLEQEPLLLLNELLDRVASQRSRGKQGSAVSEDGGLRITVDWDATADIASIETPSGFYHTKDIHIHVVAEENE